MFSNVEFKSLSIQEQKDVNGGAICGGLCLFGLGVLLGAAFGVGVVNGYNNAENNDSSNESTDEN